LVYTHTGEVVDVAGLGETDDWVDKHVCLSCASGADCKLPVGAMHGVSGLESDDAGPAQLVEVKAKLSR
jgi:hypothetical protein